MYDKVVSGRPGRGRLGVCRCFGRGFTLIEVLVVAAIISLLMAIILPVLGKVKDQARAAVCMSNMRQIGIAAKVYADDWNQLIPRGTGGPLWFTAFMPYLSQHPIDDDYRNVKIYRCPSYPNKSQTVCYVVNGWGFWGSADITGHETGEPTKLSTCTRRMATIYLADNEYASWRPIITSATDDGIERCDVWNSAHLPASELADITFGRRVAQKRHRKGSNCLCLDWHVEYVRTEDMGLDMWRFHIRR